MFKWFQKTDPEIVTININDTNCCFTWFDRRKKNNSFILNAFEKFDNKDLSIHNLNLFNINLLATYLDNFLKKNKLKDCFVYIALDGIQIKDQLKKNQDFKDDLNVTSFIKVVIDKSDHFYFAQIKHSLIFQYKLLAIKSKINLAKILTGNIVDFYLLKFFKPTFLKNIDDINELQNSLNDFVDSFDMQNYIIIPDAIKKNNFEKKDILRSLGINLFEKNNIKAG